MKSNCAARGEKQDAKQNVLATLSIMHGQHGLPRFILVLHGLPHFKKIYLTKVRVKTKTNSKFIIFTIYTMMTDCDGQCW